MIKDFPYKIKSTRTAPWSEKMFKGRPDINPGISFLSTRTQKPNESNWKKLLKLLGFIEGTIGDIDLKGGWMATAVEAMTVAAEAAAAEFALAVTVKEDVGWGWWNRVCNCGR
eukprot:3198552-Ditylum_brightwellii.AAC.1